MKDKSLKKLEKIYLYQKDTLVLKQKKLVQSIEECIHQVKSIQNTYEHEKNAVLQDVYAIPAFNHYAHGVKEKILQIVIEMKKYQQELDHITQLIKEKNILIERNQIMIQSLDNHRKKSDFRKSMKEMDDVNLQQYIRGKIPS
jgi:hypothetical protein